MIIDDNLIELMSNITAFYSQIYVGVEEMESHVALIIYLINKEMKWNQRKPFSF